MSLAADLCVAFQSHLKDTAYHAESITRFEVERWRVHARQWVRMVVILDNSEALQLISGKLSESVGVIYSRTYLPRGTAEKTLLHLQVLAEEALVMSSTGHSYIRNFVVPDLTASVQELISFCVASTEAIWTELKQANSPTDAQSNAGGQSSIEDQDSLLCLLNASPDDHPSHRLPKDVAALNIRSSLAIKSICALNSLYCVCSARQKEKADNASSCYGTSFARCIQEELLRQLTRFYEEMEGARSQHLVTERDKILRLCMMESMSDSMRSLANLAKCGALMNQGKNGSLLAQCGQIVTRIVPLMISEGNEEHCSLSKEAQNYTSQSAVTKAFGRFYFHATWRSMRPLLEVLCIEGNWSKNRDILEAILVAVIEEVEVAGAQDLVELLSCACLLFDCGAHETSMAIAKTEGISSKMITDFFDGAWHNFISCLKK